MKNFKLINLLLILATSLLLVNCTTDPIPGPDGVDGVDGVDGIDGATGTAECAACHNISKSEEVHASFLFSAHSGVPNAGDNSWARGRSASCAKCHSNQGYIDYAETGMVDENGYGQEEDPLTCAGCHNEHRSFDFENDGFDAALRIVDAVTLFADPDSYVIDYGKDEKRSHTCAQCHQPRDKFENNLLANGKVDVGSRFGPHYGAQSTLLEGIQGAELDGYTYAGADKSAAHRAGSSCTQCHMGESGGNNVGEHTWIQTETSCTKCHNDNIPAKDFLKEDYETLENLLIAEGLLRIDIDPDTGDEEIRINSGEYDLVPASALWNYRMLYYDHSHGVHNPEYAKALVKNSIDALNGN